MAIFVDKSTKVIVQGLTGGQGKYHGLRNKAYGTDVVGGVTPGKGGSDVEGIPVFDTVAEAVKATGANASFIAVPPKAAPSAILEAAEASRQEHPEPPDGPKALDRVMQRAAQRKADDASRKRRKPKAVAAQETRPITDLPIFYAEMVNSDRYVPVSAISNSMRDAMLARGLVTAERLRERGIR